MTLRILPYHLRVTSSLATNLAAGYLLTIPTVNHLLVLLGSIISVIICLVIALRAERLLYQYD